MDKIFTYVLRADDLQSTAGGLVNLILKDRIHVTGHEISRAKFMPGGITADGRSVTVKDRIAPGQTLRLVLSDTASDTDKVPPVEGPITFLYEDEDIVVINKSAGSVVHPTHGHHKDTLANYLAWHYQSQGLDVSCRIAGRLDKETSGALVFAKNRATSGRLAAERRDQLFRRSYLTIVQGAFPDNKKEGHIDSPIEKAPDSLLKRQIAPTGCGDSALTNYEILGCVPYGSIGDGMITLLRVHIETGRTHQIRVHMASIGHPLLGDTLYGGLGPESGGAPRALLHAASVEFIQPFTKEEVKVTAPMPDDFTEKYSLFKLRDIDAI